MFKPFSPLIKVVFSAFLLGSSLAFGQTITAQNLTQYVEEGTLNNQGVKIHYAALGQGPLLILIHGHPDFWYGWRNQIPALAQKYKVVAIDQRGINLSDQPKGAANYSIQNQVSDIAALVAYFKAPKAILVGHDTGAAIAWAFATAFPQLTDKLITLSLPHPQALAQQIATDPQQRQAAALSLSLGQPDSASKISREQMVAVVNPTDPAVKARYQEAFARTSLESFVGYFQARPTGPETAATVPIAAPVLAIHGLRDPFVLTGGYEASKQFTKGSFTYVPLENVGHFPQAEQAGAVNKLILDWLATVKE